MVGITEVTLRPKTSRSGYSGEMADSASFSPSFGIVSKFGFENILCFFGLLKNKHRYVPIKVRHRFGNQNFTGRHTENCLAFFDFLTPYSPVKGAVNHWVTGSSPVGGAIYQSLSTFLNIACRTLHSISQNALLVHLWRISIV